MPLEDNDQRQQLLAEDRDDQMGRNGSNNFQQPLYPNNRQSMYPNNQQPLYPNHQQLLYPNNQQPMYPNNQKFMYQNNQQLQYFNNMNQIVQTPGQSQFQQPYNKFAYQQNPSNYNLYPPKQVIVDNQNINDHQNLNMMKENKIMQPTQDGTEKYDNDMLSEVLPSEIGNHRFTHLINNKTTSGNYTETNENRSSYGEI